MYLLFIFLFASTSIWPIVNSCNETKNIGHIVVITSPLFGHMIPLLDFAKYLSLHHHVTYIVSASKLDVLKRRGFLDENSDSVETRLEIIGLVDGNDDDNEVSDMANHVNLY